MYKKKIKCEIYRDSMQNYKKYAIPPAQLIIADVPYNVGTNFYGSNPMWYNGGDNKNGESKLAKKAAFNSDFNFNLYEYFHFCSKMLKKEDTKPIARGRSSKDRTKNGDSMKKPTQFFFINCEPKNNFIFESLDYVEAVRFKKLKGNENVSRKTARSMIHPQYADRFIRQYILDEEIWRGK